MAPYDVVETLGTLAVQPGIEEAERRLLPQNQVVIDQRDYASHCLLTGGQWYARGWTTKSGARAR